MRGIRILKQISQPETEQQQLFAQNVLTPYEKKVKAICARYYHYNTNGDAGGRMKHDDILLKLAEEFYISTGHIANILVKNSAEIQELRKEAPKKKWFETNWTHMVW